MQGFPGLKIVHRAGRVHSNIDPLSRLTRLPPPYDAPIDMIDAAIKLNEQECEQGWNEITYSDKQKDAMVLAMFIDTIDIHPSQIEKYQLGYAKDPKLAPIVKELMTTIDWRNPQVKNFFIAEDGLLYYKDPDENERSNACWISQNLFSSS
ncbi:hypothetical protein M408DRAFT_27694 [Serendipita vermifera MAFF 305830]|uniref:Uncharacterized protein n=1 Tax=Serendipita vermifera MAFF 305830 TaxID=933852 RepID=A0A0C3AWX4_SERVB|nr:hypothetical protein M408DRAFT_27694 [Serendipita vermifera MAFF 305830]